MNTKSTAALFVLFFCLLLQSTAFAGPFDRFNYTQKIFNTLDALASDTGERYDLALTLMSHARQFAGSEAKHSLEMALKEVKSWNKQGRRFPSDEEEKRVIFLLKESLRYHRMKFNVSDPGEFELFEFLVRAHLFPEHPNKVELGFKGIDRKMGVLLLSTFIADPRSVKYDEDVYELIMGRKSNGNPTDKRVSFKISGGTYHLPLGMDGEENILESVQTIVDQMNQSVPREMEINTTAEAKGNRVTLYLEIYGYQYVPVAQTFLQKTLAVAAPNRILFSVANGLEWAAAQSGSAYLGGSQTLQGIAVKAADTFHLLENGVRSRYLAGSWYEPNPAIVKNRLDRLSAHTVKHMEANLVKTIDRINKMPVVSDAFKAKLIKAKEARTAKWISNEGKKLKKLRKGVDVAVKEAQATEAYAAATASGQARQELVAAEKAAGMKMLTIDRALMILSVAIGGYYVIEGINQVRKTNDIDERIMIGTVYGARAINALMYGVPILQEVAIAIDVGSWIINHTVLKFFDAEFKLPNIERMVMGLARFAENAGYRTSGVRFNGIVPHFGPGVTRYQSISSRLRSQLGLNELYKLKGKWTSVHRSAFRRKAITKEQLVEREQMMTANFIRYFMGLNDFYEGKFVRELGQEESRVLLQLTSSNGGYFR